jgi:hypothetical protein
MVAHLYAITSNAGHHAIAVSHSAGHPDEVGQRHERGQRRRNAAVAALHFQVTRFVEMVLQRSAIAGKNDAIGVSRRHGRVPAGRGVVVQSDESTHVPLQAERSRRCSHPVARAIVG